MAICLQPACHLTISGARLKLDPLWGLAFVSPNPCLSAIISHPCPIWRTRSAWAMSRKAPPAKKRHSTLSSSSNPWNLLDHLAAKPCKFFQVDRCPHPADVCNFAHVIASSSDTESSIYCYYPGYYPQYPLSRHSYGPKGALYRF